MRRVRLSDGTIRDLAPNEMFPDGATLVSTRVPLYLQDHQTVSDEYRLGAARGEVLAPGIAFDAMVREKHDAWMSPQVMVPTQDARRSPAPNDARANLLRETQEAWRSL